MKFKFVPIGAVIIFFVTATGEISGDQLHATGSEVESPNVLFIAVDDLNDWVGYLGGHPDARTPNLDRLAKQGISFTRAYCSAPICGPSRASLLTGMLPSFSGVYSNSQSFRKSVKLENAVTLPQYFMANGYLAIGSGKIFHGPDPDPASWNEYWPSQTQNKPKDPIPPRDLRPMNKIPGTGDFDWGPLQVNNEEMGDWQVGNWVINQLQKEYERPFFLACGFFRPHLPWYVPAEYFEGFPQDKISLPVFDGNDLDDVPDAGIQMAKPDKDHANIIKYNQHRAAVQGYLASINFMDACLGRVLEAFENSPYKNNTVVILWSDHGWHLGEKLHWRKSALWEEATRNNLIIIAPGITKPRTVCDKPVSLIDIYPTLIDLCGLPPNEKLQGKSLIGLIKDPNSDWGRPSLTTHGYKNHSLRTEKWRYIKYADGSEELYDHDNDELEWKNLAGDPAYEPIIKELSNWLPVNNEAPY